MSDKQDKKRERFRRKMDALSLLMAKSELNVHLSQVNRQMLAAIKLGYADVLSDAISDGAQVNIEYDDLNDLDVHLDCKKITPLALAVYHNRVACVEKLLEAGADVNFRDKTNKTLLHWVIDGYKSDNLMPANPSRGDIMRAIGYKSDNVMKMLILHGADVNAIDMQGNTPLHYAVESNKKDLCFLLLMAGARIDIKNAMGKRAHDYNYGNASEKIVNEIAVCATPLHYAKNMKDEDVKFILDCGYDVNAADELGITPLHVRASHGTPEQIELLLKFGAAINVADKVGSTPLRRAFIFKQLRNFHALLCAGADVNARDIKGATLLHVVALDNDKEVKAEKIISSLIQAGADVNACDIHGNTPLHYASKALNEEKISLLLRFGAAGDAINAEGKTPHQVKVETIEKKKPWWVV